MQVIEHELVVDELNAVQGVRRLGYHVAPGVIATQNIYLCNLAQRRILICLKVENRTVIAEEPPTVPKIFDERQDRSVFFSEVFEIYHVHTLSALADGD